MTEDIFVKELLVDLEKSYLSILNNDPLTWRRLAELKRFDIQKDISKILNMHLQIIEEAETARNKILKTLDKLKEGYKHDD